MSSRFLSSPFLLLAPYLDAIVRVGFSFLACLSHQVFAANPQKPAEIIDILVGNKEKLLLFLRDFHSDKEDEQFQEEKKVINPKVLMFSR